MCHTHLFLLDFTALTLFGEDGKLCKLFPSRNLFSLLLPPPPQAQIFSTAPYSRIPSAYVIPLIWETKFHSEAPTCLVGNLIKFDRPIIMISKEGKRNMYWWEIVVMLLMMLVIVVIIKGYLTQFGYVLVCLIIQLPVEHTQHKHATGKCNIYKDGRKITNICQCNLN
jgi:hypothetical protein